MRCDGCFKERDGPFKTVKRLCIGTPPHDWPTHRHYCQACVNGDPRMTTEPMSVFDGFEGVPSAVEVALGVVLVAVLLALLLAARLLIR